MERKRFLMHKSGQPCKHRGCLSHISHPCEGCGRVGGVGNIYHYTTDDLFNDLEPLFKEKKEIG